MNSIATKDDSIATEYGKVIIQVSYDKCFYVTTKFSVEDQLKEGFLSLQKTKRREQKIGRDKEKYVVTQNTHIATKTRLLHQNYVTTESKKKLRKPIATETAGYDISKGSKTKTLSRHNFLCHDRATNLGYNFWRSTKQF